MKIRMSLLGAAAVVAAGLGVTAVSMAAVTPIPPDDYTACPTGPGVALQGDGADDTITGTDDRDLLKGGGGNDTITGARRC